MPHQPNILLNALPAADIAALRPHLKPFELKQGTILFEPGDRIHQVYFPLTGVVSLVVALTTGETIESAMVGRESVVGGSAAFNGQVAVCKAIVQIAGTSLALDTDRLKRVADDSAACRAALMRHEQLILVQAQQSAACNATHTVEARLARWLLRCRDLQGGDDLQLTQEFISQMMGVRRTSVSVVANTFQLAGLIRYSRGHIRILDVEAVQKTACECYYTVRSQAERLLGVPSGIASTQ